MVKPARGFSLLEMAIVLMVVGLVVVPLLTMFDAMTKQKRFNDTNATLNDIQNALIGYAQIYGNLPCPTTQTNPANAGYGNPDPVCPSGAEGYVPWKVLGVSEVDAWGSVRSATASPFVGYYRYRVDRNFSVPFTLATGFSVDNLSIVNSAGAMVTSPVERPVAIIFSSGPNASADGQNATYEATNGVYQADTMGRTCVPTGGGPSVLPCTTIAGVNYAPGVFDDMTRWITRPKLFAAMVQAGKLP